MEEKSLHHLVLGDRRNPGAIGKSSEGDIGRERREPYLVDQLPLAVVSHRPPKAYGLVSAVIDLEARVGLTLILGRVAVAKDDQKVVRGNGDLVSEGVGEHVDRQSFGVAERQTLARVGLPEGQGLIAQVVNLNHVRGGPADIQGKLGLVVGDDLVDAENGVVLRKTRDAQGHGAGYYHAHAPQSCNTIHELFPNIMVERKK